MPPPAGYHGAGGVAGGAADYQGSRYGKGCKGEETGIAGQSGFGHTSAGTNGASGSSSAVSSSASWRSRRVRRWDSVQLPISTPPRTADAADPASRAHAVGAGATDDTGYASGLGNTGAQGAGAGAETAGLSASGRKAGGEQA